MLNIRDLRIDPVSLGAKKLLVDIVPAYEYKDGKRTDTLTGYRYVVALSEHALEKLSVKIDGQAGWLCGSRVLRSGSRCL